MGTFMGHFLPGFMFVFFSIHWLVSQCLLFYRTQFATIAKSRKSNSRSRRPINRRLKLDNNNNTNNDNNDLCSALQSSKFRNLHSYPFACCIKSLEFVDNADGDDGCADDDIDDETGDLQLTGNTNSHASIVDAHAKFSLLPTNEITEMHHGFERQSLHGRSSSASGSCCCSRNSSSRAMCCEPLLKILLCAVGLLGECWTALDENYVWRAIGNAQHSTMYFAFLLSGIVDLLTAGPVRSPLAVLPDGANYMCTAVCFVVEALLFQFHLHGRVMTNVTMHRILVMIIWACTAIVLLEMSSWGRKSFLVGLARSYLVMLQGFWFIIVGALLYPPDGSESWEAPYLTEHQQHNKVMLITVIFGFLLILLFLLQFSFVFCLSWHHSKKLNKYFVVNGYSHVENASNNGKSKVNFKTFDQNDFEHKNYSDDETIFDNIN